MTKSQGKSNNTETIKYSWEEMEELYKQTAKIQ